MAEEPQPSLQVPSRTNYLWIEVGVVLLACIAPAIFSSVRDVYSPVPSLTVPFAPHAWSYVLDHGGQIALILFIIWRSNDPFSRFGIQPFQIGKDLVGGIAIFLVLQAVHLLISWILYTCLSHRNLLTLLHSATQPNFYPPSGAPEYVLLGIYCLVSGYSQELAMRAYLITRLEELLESTPIALLLSTVLFASYHGYEGNFAVMGIALDGLLLGVAFCLFRRLSPLAFAHALGNFFAIGHIVLPNGFRL